MGQLKIYPYKIGSESARALARALGVKRIIPEGSYRPTERTMVINWGSSSFHFNHSNVLNKPAAVAIAANKLSTLSKLRATGVPVPDFTTSHAEAMDWLDDDYRVLVRNTLTGHSGAGIQVIRPGDTLPYGAPLYTRYTRKDSEYRVHVFKGSVIDYSEKRKRNGGEAVGTSDSNLIRNHSNGWVFCRDGVYLSDMVRAVAIKAVAALGLDFGALDIIVRGDKCYVLEVNTAPGVEGTTLQKYVEAFRPYVNTVRSGGIRHGYQTQEAYRRNWG